jgi:hypothetical protein
MVCVCCVPTRATSFRAGQAWPTSFLIVVEAIAARSMHADKSSGSLTAPPTAMLDDVPDKK